MQMKPQKRCRWLASLVIVKRLTYTESNDRPIERIEGDGGFLQKACTLRSEGKEDVEVSSSDLAVPVKDEEAKKVVVEVEMQ